MSANELEKSEEIEKAEVLPILPLRNTVLFPFTTMPLSVGRPASVAAIEAALATESKELVVVAQVRFRCLKCASKLQVRRRQR